ncbi:hypothetical protein BAE44_0013722 [Dichanthelium oligosanthes]|uniref:Uncharacterized protein n=1 Tax=Dichanthelium oligosanthes TaxID=888268 RepID=A0A1E5VJF3_9POAL|nr:hypothetical protein BAE44_0013722 [Dichanthelium oligosanthes]
MPIGLVYKDAAMRKEIRYTAPPRAHPDENTIDMRILAVAQNHTMEAEYDDYSPTNASTAAFCRSASLVEAAALAATEAGIHPAVGEREGSVLHHRTGLTCHTSARTAAALMVRLWPPLQRPLVPYLHGFLSSFSSNQLR